MTNGEQVSEEPRNDGRDEASSERYYLVVCYDIIVPKEIYDYIIWPGRFRQGDSG